MPPVMSPVCAAICRDPGYLSALEDKGILHTDTFQYAGKTYGHDDIVAICEDSYLRHRNEFALPDSGRAGFRRLERRNKMRLRRAVMIDVGSFFGMPLLKILFELAAGFITGGYLGLVFAIAQVFFDWYSGRDLAGDMAIAAMAGV